MQLPPYGAERKHNSLPNRVFLDIAREKMKTEEGVRVTLNYAQNFLFELTMFGGAGQESLERTSAPAQVIELLLERLRGDSTRGKDYQNLKTAYDDALAITEARKAAALEDLETPKVEA